MGATMKAMSVRRAARSKAAERYLFLKTNP